MFPANHIPSHIIGFCLVALNDERVKTVIQLHRPVWKKLPVGILVSSCATYYLLLDSHCL